MILRILRTPKYWIIAIVLLGVYSLSTTLYYSYSRREVDQKSKPKAVLLRRPFVKDEPKLVILLSYQRSGSSFVGEWFNTNPDVFYNFEPVDSLYSAMYGTPQNTNAPSDITNYPNGSARILSDDELNAVSSFLEQFFQCDLDRLPTQSLMNFYFIRSFRQFQAARRYSRCLRKTFSNNTFRRCEPHLTGFCGSRFGQESESTQKDCFRRIWLKKYDLSTKPIDANITLNFTKSQHCFLRQRLLLKARCQHILLAVCRKHPIRVIKTVRATMKSMEPLLKTIPNFRVVHLVRDPRAVALSRKRFGGNVRGIYSGNDNNTIAREAKLYCSTAVRDIRARLRLERDYPGKIYALVYDELIINTNFYLDQVYEFIDEKPPSPVVKWLSTHGKTNIRTNQTSLEIARRWQYDLDDPLQNKIVQSCREFYQLTRYAWDLTRRV